MCLLLGATGVGKTLLLKRLQRINLKDNHAELGEPPATLPTFMVDAANTTQVSSSCIQLLSVLSAEALETTSVLILFNKVDIPCPMSLVEMKSLFRLDDIISCARQPITVLGISARSGQGLQDVLKWLHSIQKE
ncbi:ADP-ribosylation factor-like protein 16 isoform X2 [Acipenser ruthenus]|uniref:ADP-ribosylation factor-like protein 16 isoform X2 n=1 Tax=Acipenser ruthenus TaxID=7906 RepID=UPI002741C959|nr:ADP-ribosylation factor-like protein 16 isoform X2 [Acipenser ruthenus]